MFFFRRCSSRGRAQTAFLCAQRFRLSAPPSAAAVGPSPQQQSSSEPAMMGVPFDSPEDVEETFKCSVEARTVSNAQLRVFIRSLPAKDYNLALAAVKGAKEGGLRLNAPTYEALLAKLIEGGQMRAAMELYQHVLTLHVTPTPKTYAMLMQMCLQRDMPSACQSLYREMIKRGAKPQPENYELMIASLAAENPPKWEMAVEIFEKLSHEKGNHLTTKTYNSLMMVYMNMVPFDWRVVYNCYHELRTRKPRIPLSWDSYLIVREALKRGEAGYVRRFLTYFDAWCAVTSIRSWDFVVGVLVYFAIFFVLKSIVSYGILRYLGFGGEDSSGSSSEAESIISR